MWFSVVYSVDVPAEGRTEDYAPPDVELWDQTEDDGQYEYSYLEGEWLGGHHRKWAAFLERQQFDDFIDHCQLRAEDVQTLGTIGAPGCGFGWAPAISFVRDHPAAILSAYVTPLPNVRRKELSSDDWDRVRGAVLAVYG